MKKKLYKPEIETMLEEGRYKELLYMYQELKNSLWLRNLFYVDYYLSRLKQMIYRDYLAFFMAGLGSGKVTKKMVYDSLCLCDIIEEIEKDGEKVYNIKSRINLASISSEIVTLEQGLPSLAIDSLLNE